MLFLFQDDAVLNHLTLSAVRNDDRMQLLSKFFGGCKYAGGGTLLHYFQMSPQGLIALFRLSLFTFKTIFLK